MPISPPTNLDRVIDIASIFYLTKNQVRGLCVGGDMTILFYRDQRRTIRPKNRLYIGIIFKLQGAL